MRFSVALTLQIAGQNFRHSLDRTDKIPSDGSANSSFSDLKSDLACSAERVFALNSEGWRRYSPWIPDHRSLSLRTAGKVDWRCRYVVDEIAKRLARERRMIENRNEQTASLLLRGTPGETRKKIVHRFDQEPDANDGEIMFKVFNGVSAATTEKRKEGQLARS